MIIFFFSFLSLIHADTKVGGFLDTYIAFDSNGPEDHERSYTTQAVRHNEFNVNLTHIDLTLQREKSRGRIAAQTGNSVSKNYAAEPGDSRFIQEGYAGIKLDENTWIDMGIFFGNIGMESWISRNNFTYTRSLMAEYSPYYSSGVRLERIMPNSSFQLHIINGWQNIVETNEAKALGMQYKKGQFTYNNFLGDERVVSLKDRFRHFHNFIFQRDLNPKWQFLGSIDIGFQSQQKEKGVDAWGATSLICRNILSDEKSLSYRLEYYVDPHQANVVTGTQNGFQVLSGSVNYDLQVDAKTLFRNEVRTFHSRDKIYPTGVSSWNQWDSLFVSSIALTF